MATFDITVGDQVFEIESEGSAEEVEAYFATPEGQTELQRKMQEATKTQPGESVTSEAPDVAAAGQAAQQKVADELSPVQKTLVGAGKVVNDVVQGVQQLTGSEEQSNAIALDIKNQKEAWEILDGDSIGWEDLGEILGDTAMFAVGGAGAATVKGGAILGGIIEGIKGVEEDESRAGNATGGVLGGAIGGKLSSGLIPDAAKHTKGAINSNALVNLFTGGVARLMNFGKSEAERLVVSGSANLLRKGKQAIDLVTPNKPPSAAASSLAVRAKRDKLNAARQKEINDLGVEMYERAAGIMNRMSSTGRAGVFVQSTHHSLQKVMNNAAKEMSDGRVGIKIADFLKELPFTNKQLDQALGTGFSRQLRKLIAEFKSRADEVVSPAQIAAEISEYADLVINGGIKIDSLGRTVQEQIMHQVRAAGRRAALVPAQGAQAAGADTFQSQAPNAGSGLVDAAQGLAQR